MYALPGPKQPGLKDRLSESARESYTWLRDYVTAIKAGRLHPFTSVERKAREATRREPWGPTGTMLAELAELSEDLEHCQVIFAVLDYRLTREPAKWRNVYKALLLLEFLLKRGSLHCPRMARSELSQQLQSLSDFAYIGADGRDYGVNVRVRSQAVCALLANESYLQQQRQIAAERARTYAGYSSEQLPARQPVGSVSEPYSLYGDTTTSTDGLAEGGYAPINRTAASDGGAAAAASAPAATSTATSRARSSTAASAAPYAQRAGVHGAAGETKGVSFAKNKAHLEALRAVLAREGNRRCADCADGSGAARPSWASINTGVFLCLTCAGVHRGLGVHISQVRSCSLDTWLPHQVAFMASTGNAAANAYYEARLPANTRPARGSPLMAEFIRRKYASKEWAGPGPWPPAEEPAAESVTEAVTEQQQHRQGAQAGSSVPDSNGDVPVAPSADVAAEKAVAAAAAAAAQHIDLICLDDEPAPAPAVANGGPAKRPADLSADAPLWELLDDPSMDVMEWLGKSIASGADAAAERAMSARAEALRSGTAAHGTTHSPPARAHSAANDVITTYEFMAFSSDDEADFTAYNASKTTGGAGGMQAAPATAKGTVANGAGKQPARGAAAQGQQQQQQQQAAKRHQQSGSGGHKRAPSGGAAHSDLAWQNSHTQQRTGGSQRHSHGGSYSQQRTGGLSYSQQHTGMSYSQQYTGGAYGYAPQYTGGGLPMYHTAVMGNPYGQPAYYNGGMLVPVPYRIAPYGYAMAHGGHQQMVPYGYAMQHTGVYGSYAPAPMQMLAPAAMQAQPQEYGQQGSSQGYSNSRGPGRQGSGSNSNAPTLQVTGQISTSGSGAQSAGPGHGSRREVPHQRTGSGASAGFTGLAAQRR